MSGFRVAVKSGMLCIIISLLLLLLDRRSAVDGSPPEEPVKCDAVTCRCTVTNAYGMFPDRSICHAGNAAFPPSEEELLEAVANATAARRKIRVVSRYSHSVPKLVCPGGDDGLVISTHFLDRLVSVDVSGSVMTVESGMVLEDFVAEAAKAGLALPHAPYWAGVTVGGILGTGAHGSSLWGKGSAVHEYVVGLRIVSPASEADGYAKVTELDSAHPDLDAFKVNLGVLGVISQVTFILQPIFKRSVTFSESKDTDLSDQAVIFGQQHEFADMKWYPSHGKVVYRADDRVPTNTTGNGLYDYIPFRSTLSVITAITRSTEEIAEATNDADIKCTNALLYHAVFEAAKYGMTNDGDPFAGYPVVGFQNRIQSSGGCLSSPDDDLLSSCPWDPRLKQGIFMHQSGISIPLSKVKNFILDVQKLRDSVPKSLCGVELYDGILMRYVKASSAFLGKQEDALDFDISYYRSHDPAVPRMFEDVLEEMEQMAIFKYGGLPHWGKNRNLVFDGIVTRYANNGAFVKVKDAYDPDGLFSNEWTDQVLGIKGNASIYGEGCALEGLCICSLDIHCAPQKGYFCRPGKVYTDARVCSTSN